MTLAEQVAALQRQVDRDTGEAKAIAAAGKRLQARISELEAQVELYQKVSGLFTSLGEQRQQRAQEQIEQLVTRGLQAIFEENLSFHLVQSVKANQAVVDFVVRSSYGGEAIDTPVMDARGGGLAATVGFMLRLVVLLLTPGGRRLLVLDESFAHVSAEYRPRLAEFLREVADKTGTQIIMITHDPEYDEVADTRYRLALKDGVTEVTRL